MALGVMPAANFWPTNLGFRDIANDGDETLLRNEIDQFKESKSASKRGRSSLNFDEVLLCTLHQQLSRSRMLLLAPPMTFGSSYLDSTSVLVFVEHLLAQHTFIYDSLHVYT
jgi:hypothetical protein